MDSAGRGRTGSATLPPPRQALGERIDGQEKVRGAAKYAADIHLPGMLYGAVLRSPFPHASLSAIDVDAARALPGVHAVLTGGDLPDARLGRGMRDMPVLTRDKVRFVGEKVVGIAAESKAVADQALSLIRVDYDELPAVFDPFEAMRPGAPLIHEAEKVRAWKAPQQVVPDYPNGVSAPAYGASLEEVQRALQSADRVIEHTLRTPIQHQAYLEPHACLVDVSSDGVAHIWASQKAPILLATYLEEGLGLTRDQMDIHMLPVGGDFGGKGSFMDVPLAYFLSRASERPVKMVMSYTDELVAANPRHACTLVIASGVNADGTIVARWLRAYFSSGGYAAFKPAPDATLPGFKRGAVGPYQIAVQRNECHMVYTNTVPCGNMRSPGEAQAAYGLEVHTDLIARELGMDPVELRIKNGSHHARATESGEPGSPPRIREVLEAVAESIDLAEKRPPDIGRGVALVEFSTTPGIYSGGMTVQPRGDVTVQTPIIEQGAGMLTVFRQIVAEELGISVERVHIRQGIENLTVDRGVGGSRVTRLVGKLMIQLSRRIQTRLAELLAAEYGVSPEAIRIEPGSFQLPDGRQFSFVDTASLAHEEIHELATLDAQPSDRSVVFMAQAAEVHVDPETGQVKPLRLTSAHEIGRVINPMLFEAQIDGGLIQGLGYALMEGVVLHEGRVANVNLNDYKVPTVADAPPINRILLEPDYGLGITPVGEGPNAGIAPAVVNAVVDAIGAHPLDIPLSSERLSQLLAAERS